MDSSMRERLLKLSTTNVSDALDALGYKGSTYGVRPMYEGVGKIAGSAVTVKMTAAGETKGKVHLGIRAIEAAQPGDIVGLSPACAAFDRFKNFMERGQVFKQLVQEL